MSKDVDVMALRETLLAKEASLLGTEKPVYKTGGIFRPYQFQNRNEFDIRTANKAQLLDGFKHLTNHKAAANELGVDDKHIGFTVEEWTHDFKLRVKVLNRAENLAYIEKLKGDLRLVLTPKQLREIGIADLAADIKAMEV
jgi:hypothetical protein